MHFVLRAGRLAEYMALPLSLQGGPAGEKLIESRSSYLLHVIDQTSSNLQAALASLH